MFTLEQKAALAAPLSRSNVKARTQAGRQVSYVESWLAISEANRIFGFDGWSSETVEIKCVSERERRIGKEPNAKDGWGVSYTAKVRVVAFAGDSLVVREGVGAGHGIDVDLGQAHESAIKEAESDSRKRAFMTFGNPFGLALYDKTQASVGEDGPAPVTLIERNAFMVECRDAIAGFADAEQLLTWWNSDAQKKARRDYQLDKSQVETLKVAVTDRRGVLMKVAA
jgi:DNA repair and recombination protein RAD52